MGIIPFILAFVAALIVDWAWAFYIIAIAEKRAFRAAAVSSLIVLLAGTNAVLAMHNASTILAAGAGAFVGTYYGIRRSNNQS